MRRSFLIIAVLAGAASARAGVITEDPLADTSTSAGVIARQYSYVLAGSVLERPYLPMDENPSAIGAFDLRPYFSTKTASWKFVAHDELIGIVQSYALAGLGLGRTVPPPLWLPLTATIAEDPTVTLRDSAAWLYAAYTHGPITITAGRQPIAFGRAKLWSPMDLIAPFSLTEIDTEYRFGVDALRVDFASGDRFNATVVGVIGELQDDYDLQASIQGSAVLARPKYRLDHGEIGGLVGYVRGDAVVGGDGIWDTGSFDLYGEATMTLVTSQSLPAPAARGAIAKAALGATFHPTSKLTIDPELLYNGEGAWHAAGYAAVALSERFLIGEQVTLGRIYAAAVADWQPHPLLHVVADAISNLQDPSALASVALVYSVSDDTTAQLGGYVSLGRRPSRTSPPVPRSEYGLYPLFAFLELKAVL